MSDEHSAGGSELTHEERAQIDRYFTLRTQATFYELLDVPRDANRRTIRDAYFELSKRYHPDVFFKRNLGAYRPRLDEVFRAFTKAYDVLSNPRQRSGYDLLIGNIQDAPDGLPPAPEAPVAPVAWPEPEELPRGPVAEPSHTPSAPGATSRSTPGATSSWPPRATDSSPPALGPKDSSVARPSPAPMSSHEVPVMPTGGVPSAVVRAPRPFANDEVSARPVIPAPLRTSSAPPPFTVLPLRTPVAASALDTAARARAMETMARRLTGSTGQHSVPTHSQYRPGDSMAPGANFARTAMPDLEAVVAERKAQADQLVAQGEEAQKLGKLDRALEYYQSASQIVKEDEEIRARIDALKNILAVQQTNESIDLAREAGRKGRAEESARLWEKAWEGRPGDMTLLLNAADVIAKHTKDHKRAIELCQKIVMVEPKNIKALVIMARTFIDAGMRASARGAIENVAKLEGPLSPVVKDLRERLGPLTLAEQLGLRNR